MGGRTGIGALFVGVYDGSALLYAGKVGTGFSVASLRGLRSELCAIERKQSLFDENSPRRKELHWVLPTRVCEVSFAEWTRDGMLRHPVFKGQREDKPAKEIHVEKKKSEISSPQKLIFKNEGITKKDVAVYYQKVSEVMLPYLKDRLLTLVRCPKGPSEGCFYQKHFTGHLPSAFIPVPIIEDKGEAIYISIHNAEGLQKFVQLNAYEIHT